MDSLRQTHDIARIRRNQLNAATAFAIKAWLNYHKPPRGTFIPPPPEVSQWGSVQRLVEAVPLEDEISSDIIAPAFNNFAVACEDHTMRIKKVLLDQLPGNHCSSPTDVGQLELATSVFECSRSELRDGPPLHWMDEYVQWHECVGKRQYSSPKVPYQPSKCLRFHPGVSGDVVDIVRSVGLDPKTATYGDMDAMDARFRCENCPRGDNVVRNWRNCVSTNPGEMFVFNNLICMPHQAAHLLDHPRAVAWNRWTLLSDPEANVARALELRNPYERPRWLCRLCSLWMPLSRLAIQEHIQTEYDIRMRLLLSV